MKSSLSKRSILKLSKFSFALYWFDNPIYIISINFDISLKRKILFFLSITIRERSRNRRESFAIAT